MGCFAWLSLHLIQYLLILILQMIRTAQVIKRFSSLTALSPLDGRYSNKIESLSPYFSQSALMKYRVIVQSRWLLHMLQYKIIEPVKGVSYEQTQAKLKDIINKFNLKSAEKIKEIQKTTNHDLKSVQYFIKNNIEHYKESIHFCCTSQDINNLSYGLMLKDSMNHVILPKLHQILNSLIGKSQKWASHAMLAHTHGQPASPTTIGKQYANFAYRLSLQISHLNKTKIYGKFNGAVGNFNAHYFTYPNLNWQAISKSFIQQNLGLQSNLYTTQIQSHDSLCRVFTQIGSANTILIGLNRDTWQYISKGYLKQKTKEGEIGSSTMPHKVNPIDFENSQGNLGIANSLIDHFRSKLPISRQQRDLSDSTVLRNQGSALGYSLIGYDSLLKGLGKIDSNQTYLKQQLSQHLQVVTQAIQTELRKIGYPEPYELLKNLSRGKSFDKNVFDSLLIKLKGDIPQQSYKKISQLRPQNYLGIAQKLALQIKNVSKQIINK